MSLLRDDKHRCCGMVSAKTNFGKHRPCSRNATVYDEASDKWYCGTHAPAAKQAREYKRQQRIKDMLAKSRRRIDAEERMRQRAAAYPIVKSQRDELADTLGSVLSQLPVKTPGRHAALVLLQRVRKSQAEEPEAQ